MSTSEPRPVSSKSPPCSNTADLFVVERGFLLARDLKLVLDLVIRASITELLSCDTGLDGGTKAGGV